ncbi:hypothetical protein OIV83_006282 [Microbotryomycetes sp. JL201]|nr:hypothetical protein OIV83_006282 [Microbotryomycetes sp. JL201]
MQVDGAPAYSILRIKRKRTAQEQPLEALIIGDGHEPSVKRRRQSRPSNAFAREHSTARRQPGVFHFAQTVAVASFDDELATKQLQSRISAALQAGATSPPPEDSQHSTGTLPDTAAKPSATERTRLRIINIRKRPSAPALRPCASDAPPVVRSAKDIATAAQPQQSLGPSRIYDAVIDAGDEKTANPINIASQAEDDMMSNFVPMLEEFLSMQDNVEPTHQASSPAKTLASSSNPTTLSNGAMDDDDADYVYDVYYRDLREPSDLEGAVIGPAGYDVSKLAGLTRIGEIAGLDDFDDVLTAQVSSEEEDEADEDSNEENDYRNDYPDEDAESADEDYEYD